MAFSLMPLPFAKDALAPHMSAQTLDFHHEKHHKTYVDTLNKLIVGTPFADAPLEDIIRNTAKDKEQTKIFNNAAQVWNHNFFWNCLSPKGGNKPSGNVAQQIDKAFGNLDDFKAKFKEAATSQFGSGWAWLVLDQGQLKITKTSNAVNPLTEGQKALLTCDVWEHAYYLDYQNRRADMVDVFLEKLINWEFVAQNMDQGTVSKAA
jgi:Fe-Mn family superoxide dismutase